MKLFALAFLVACAYADVSHLVNPEANAKILSQELDVGVEGSYQWAFQTDNGISAQARGELTNPQSDNAAQVVQGQASWSSPEGEQISVQYVADENGYQPQGSHLPTPPPIPAAIQRALQYIAEHPPKEEPRS
ncbi:larval cuticle protein LCP-17-like [Ostrinia furnacalis]|uniref:larval cuticle protein LCP-17-like n=1 Tax=Ostrinia furnacalis TaxID=93504 RepID=UPI00103A33BD|nr:larval cuticle protein LCP-17-like [Ostrinia furnacalis]